MSRWYHPYYYIEAQASKGLDSSSQVQQQQQQSIKLPPILADNIKSNDVHDNVANGTRKFFTNKTKAIVWGMQQRAVQSMLDFDFICR